MFYNDIMTQQNAKKTYLSNTTHCPVNWVDVQDTMSSTAHLRQINGAFLKATFDKICIILSLPLVIPLCILVALAIKLESKGSVLFTQERTGLNAKTFTIYKFRTMTEAACKNDVQVEQSQKKDMRHTKVGRFLRRLSIDELPQLINILKGDMSIIGPRPHARYHDELFLGLDKDYAKRFRVKPGLTGWAQIHGCRGMIENSQQVHLRTQYDNEYIDQWNLRKEVIILLKTVLIVIGGDNV